MSISSKSKNQSISQEEITELTQYLNGLLKEIDAKTILLKSSSPTKLIDDCDGIKDIQNISSSTIQYVSSPDNDNVDITNVAAYQEVQTHGSDLNISCNNQCFDVNDEAQSSDFDSIDSDITSFSPNTPYPTEIDNKLHSKLTRGSLETISTIDTICRPPVETPQPNPNAFAKLNNAPFHLFNMSHLDATTTGYVKLKSRSVSYYGEYPYKYSHMEHKPRKFEENTYLLHILSYMKIVLPDLNFNSAMIHKYDDGKSSMPHHSDDEACIESGSDIASISLGDSRCMEFKNKDTGEIIQVELAHGDVLTMTKESQNLFTHAIRPEPEKKQRMSITLRQIILPHNVNGPDSNSQSMSTITDFLCNLNDNGVGPDYTQPAPAVCPSVNPPTNNGYQDNTVNLGPNLPDIFQRQMSGHRAQESQFHWQREGWQPPRSHSFRAPPIRPAQPPPMLYRDERQTHQDHCAKFPPTQLHPSRRHTQTNTFKPFKRKQKQDVVFISSSMFADLDPAKLSSVDVNANLFFYRGADSYQMMDRLRRDVKAQDLSRQNSVVKVFLLTGTNNVDSVCNNRQSIRDAYSSLSQTINYVQSLFSKATVNVINILPRVSENRKKVITQLNSHIKNFVGRDTTGKLTYVDTYSYRLFTSYSGIRKSDLFKHTHNNDNDNVHLNDYGVIKLGRHLKYLAHQ